MLTFVLHPQNRTIRASSLEEFVERYRASSRNPESSTEEFMKACARRARNFQIELDTSTPEAFTISLMRVGWVSLVRQELQ